MAYASFATSDASFSGANPMMRGLHAHIEIFKAGALTLHDADEGARRLHFVLDSDGLKAYEGPPSTSPGAAPVLAIEPLDHSCVDFRFALVFRGANERSR